MTLESLTVDQLGALCGLERNRIGAWVVAGVANVSEFRLVAPNNQMWVAWPDGNMRPYIARTTTEHAALLALARHMNLTPKDDTVPTYKRIERNDPTYAPKHGDILCFPDGQRWTIRSSTTPLWAGPDDFPCAVVVSWPVLSLSTHIERPVRTVTVPKEGYVPRVGDRLCGPEGNVVFSVQPAPRYAHGLSFHGANASVCVTPNMTEALVSLCHHIERDES